MTPTAGGAAAEVLEAEVLAAEAAVGAAEVVAAAALAGDGAAIRAEEAAAAAIKRTCSDAGRPCATSCALPIA